MTFKLLTDSTADLDENWATAHDVEILGLTIQLDGEIYETVGPNRLTSEKLLESMKNGGKPTTSQVNVGQFEESFRRHAQNGDAVLYLAFSSVLSGTYQSSMIARDLVLEEFPDATIEIVDTLAAAGGEGYLSVLAAAARDEGKTLEETKAMIIDILPRLRTYFLVDDLYHLMHGGRLSKTSAIMGSLANIKPLAHRTAVVAYANDLEGAESLKESLLEHDMIDEVLIMPLGPVISAHVGPGTLAVFTIGKDAR